MIATAPLTIIVDDREKAPYAFTELGEVYVLRQRLVTGDYSLPFLTEHVAVSRKDLADLYATVLDPERRNRFERELARMQTMRAAMVVIEEPYSRCAPPQGFTSRQRTVVCQWCAERCDRVAPVVWTTCEGRREAEVATMAFLMAFREKVDREGEGRP